ncbi:GNAT family N-acetyltransferase [Mangrovimonas aestuarii]|uniref:GNAT family N-acetyltransferase n=1 Tax=Mangrovimonas aestuarii TaxID=3018443 RepID=UPI0023780A6B|nr:GNAT family N-acetyltransferase [Mangrovimonas aestuarii]
MDFQKIMNIRQYKASDKSTLIEILKKNVPEYFAEKEIEDLNQYLDYGVEEYFVVEINGETVGAGGINFKDNRRIGIISWDYIKPKYHGMGIGRALLKYRLDTISKRNTIKKVIVRTSQKTYPFYAKGGFEVKEIVKDYWAEGFDLYYMEMSVNRGK